ncbi:hypothetical protein DPSP01_006148 [Paraphaeosphaeria sporulosa]
MGYLPFIPAITEINTTFWPMVAYLRMIIPTSLYSEASVRPLIILIMAAAATDVAARNLAIAYNSWNHGSDETGAAQLTLSSWVDKTAFRACGLAMGIIYSILSV